MALVAWMLTDPPRASATKDTERPETTRRYPGGTTAADVAVALGFNSSAPAPGSPEAYA